MALTTPAVDLSSGDESGITVKQEKEDDAIPAKKQKKTPEPPKKPITISDSAPTIASAVQSSSKSSEPEKPLPPAIDFASSCGAFGWTTIGSVHLPFIMRGEERFIAVRMVECKVIGSYADILPVTVFTCTNIKSYYVTENEAKLLNEINGFHCDFQFGYQTFSPKDVVVCLKDTIKFYEFLETCKVKLNIPGANPIFADHCGYFQINYSPVPFVKKGTQKYIPLNMIYPEGMTPPMENVVEITEWDLAYLKFLCTVANLDPMKLSFDVQLCSAEELQTALGGVPFEEWWPDLQCSSSKVDLLHHSSSNSGAATKWSESTSSGMPYTTNSAKKLREKFSEVQEKESLLNQFSGLSKYLDVGTPLPKAAQVSRNDQQNLVSPAGALDNFLVTSSCNYLYPLNYSHHYSSHMPTTVPDYDISTRKSSASLPSLSSHRSRPYPPPPPLVRVGSSRVNSIPGDSNIMPKSAPPMYPYLPPNSNSSSNPWFSRIFDSNFLPSENRSVSVLPTPDGPENLSQRLSDAVSWSSTPSIHLNGAGSSTTQNSSMIREIYDPNHTSHHSGSPRLLAGPGPPPHYPTPPQSSPLQPLSLGDPVNIPGVTDIYATRSTPNGLLDLCSPPPSPDTRTVLSSSPRASHLSSYSYQPHMTRLVQVESRYIVAINVEPFKYNSYLAVPVSEVVNKFLRGANVQSCQLVLTTVFGLHLYDCTSLQLEAFGKHSSSIVPGSKLILLTDLKNCLYQLKWWTSMGVMVEKEKIKNCGTLPPSELPMSKRWGSAREC